MAAVDPSTYTAGGADSSVIITNSTTVTVTSITGSSEAWLSDDIGVGEVGNFTLLATLEITSVSGLASVVPIGMSNTLGDLADMLAADDGIGVLLLYTIGNFTLSISDAESDSTSSASASLSTGTEYFLTLERSGSSATLTIRTGSHGGTVVDTVTFSVSTDLYRYSFLTQSRGAGGGSMSYTMTDIDLDFVGTTGFNPAWASQRSRMINPGLN